MTERSKNGATENGAARQGELAALLETFRATSPNGSRRDFARWAAVAAGAAATAKFGVASASATPAPRSRISANLQDVVMETGATITIPLDPWGQAVTLDPHRTVNWGPFWALFPNIWGGLVRFNENGQVEYDLAESHEVRDGGLTYRFRIRPDAKYANGSQVLAEHFVASWRRALDPSRLSPMSSYMAQVKNFARYTTRNSRNIGFRAADELIVDINLEEPSSYFLSYLAAFVWSVVDPAVLEEAGDEEFVLADAGTGPWRVTEFDPANQLVLEPNQNYYDGVSPSIAKIVWTFVTGPTAASTALNLYKQGAVVSADVPLSLKSTVERDPQLTEELRAIEPSGSTRSIAMDFKQPPFNDVRVRRAIALGVDREAWANQIWEGAFAPTGVFTPPVLTLTSGYQPPDGFGTNVDEAKQLLEEAGFPNGEGLPPITYYEPDEDTDDEKARWGLFLESLRSSIGVTITQDTSKSAQQILDLQQDNGGRQFDIMWWSYDTETPHILSTVFSSESPNMKGIFNWDSTLEPSGDFNPGADSEAFDGLVAEADRLPLDEDAERRNDLYRQAEELVLKNAVYVPLGNWKQLFVQKPWLQGTKQGAWTGRIPIRFDREVVVMRHDEGTPEAQ